MIWLSIQQVYSLSTLTGTQKKTALAFEFCYIILFYTNLKMISVHFFSVELSKLTNGNINYKEVASIKILSILGIL
jgi:hypothetical protein